MPEPGDLVEFNRVKYLRYIRPLGTGGTGDTRLFKDETTDTFFAVKKYAPTVANDIAENYDRFIQEVKILFDISHQNIVRVYNHYLFPEQKTGFLQMEYIDGRNIDVFTPHVEKTWNDIFIETVRAFQYLESKNILHRDIRPSNILIDVNDNVKIIDFGFGKKLDSASDAAGSIFLNWPVSERPLEVVNQHRYTQQSEIFFLGKLFSHIELDSDFVSFRFHHIIRKMTEVDPNRRYQSFTNVLEEIQQEEFLEIGFDENDKEIYQSFVGQFTWLIGIFKSQLKMERDVNKILQSIKNILSLNLLEKEVQNSKDILSCFMKHQYTYYPNRLMDVDALKLFYQFLSKLPYKKQQTVLDNFHNKLSLIEVVVPDFPSEDVPF